VAVDLSHDGGHRSLEVRAATSLSRLLMRQGKREEARQVLGPVYGWFTEGFDTADLKAAKQVLDSLERPA
jgi:predicted ATPase